VDRARKLVGRELERLAASPVSARVLERAKQQLKGSMMLSLESMSNRMMRLGRVELTFERYFTLDEVTAEIDAVTAQELRAAAEDLFRPERLSTIVFVPAA
jgi:predicted Zn-dependent peptidase